MHTPGPWQINATSTRVESSQFVRIADPAIKGVTEQERRDNARLIAAAPDLLAALERFTNWPPMYRQDGLKSAYEAAEAAIAKATGNAQSSE